jgi:ATP-dependent Clp protease ATP-binding subunit ClpB
LKRAIQKLIQDPLALKILEGEVLHGDHVVVDADVPKRQMTFTVNGREPSKAKGTPTSKTA